MKTETVLVTGGSGYVGSWCVAELLQRGYRVRTTVRSLAKEPALRSALAAQVDPGDRLKVCAADLTADAGWDEAVAACDYVLHVASPMGGDVPHDPDALVIPARAGSLRVLRAATNARVKRVVMTSSVAAATASLTHSDAVNDERVWTNPDEKNLNAYRLSKTLAERAAWDYMSRVSRAASPTTLTTILPTAVFGPLILTDTLGSVQVIGRLLNGQLPGVPRLGFTIVDVRNVADVHIRAMTSPAAAGQRFIASSGFMWLSDIARTLREKLGARAQKIPTRTLPDVVLRLASVFDPTLRMVTHGLGRRYGYTSQKAQQMLGWTPRPVEATVIDCAESLLAIAA